MYLLCSICLCLLVTCRCAGNNKRFSYDGAFLNKFQLLVQLHPVAFFFLVHVFFSWFSSSIIQVHFGHVSAWVMPLHFIRCFIHTLISKKPAVKFLSSSQVLSVADTSTASAPCIASKSVTCCCQAWTLELEGQPPIKHALKQSWSQACVSTPLRRWQP